MDDFRQYYYKVIHRKNWATWMWAGVGAFGMNLMLFAMMPNLLHRSSAPPLLDTLVPQINVIRIRRPDTPVERKQPKLPEPVAKKIEVSVPAYRLSTPRNYNIPFEVNTRLPAGSDSVQVPPMAQMAVNIPDTSGIAMLGDLDQPLVTLTRMPPFYPLEAKRRGIEGWVNVKFVVNKQGQPENISVVEAKPPRIFDASVLRCISGWRFKPGTIQGLPVKVWAETTIRFELE
ncbi:MAG: energy transducer TonB [Proteobacteria bacterium]|nr:energy transducer TonB [Pseudomonadota bacterium]